jgi:hypothetical protein
MKSTSGAGVLFACGRQIHILYDLVQQEGLESAPVVGQIFGDAEALHEAFYAPRSTLRLANGRTAAVVLQNCESRGAADVRIVGPMRWD